MISKMPFLRPNVVKRATYEKYFDLIDESHYYSNYGPLNTRFENRVGEEVFHGKGLAVTVNNATIGLMLAMEHARRKGGRYALMPSFTFAATPLAAQWCGLEPYFIDVNPGDWCINYDEMEAVLKRLGDEVAVVVPYATFGTCMDLTPYVRLHEQGVPVVVDAAPCFGTRNDGGEQFGEDFPGTLVFSFHATKAFGVGEGGMLYSADRDAISWVRQAGNFGFSIDRASVCKGLNSKISEYVAAVALATLDVYQDKIDIRQQIYKWYLQRFDAHGLWSLGWSAQHVEGIVPFQIISVLCPKGRTNGEFVRELAAAGIECKTYFSPACHQQRQFHECPRTGLAVTDDISGRVISLPLWEDMTSADVDRVAETIRAITIRLAS